MNRRKEIIKIRAEINKIEFKKQDQRSMNPRASSFKKINKIEKTMFRLSKKKRGPK